MRYRERKGGPYLDAGDKLTAEHGHGATLMLHHDNESQQHIQTVVIKPRRIGVHLSIADNAKRE